MAKSFSFPEYKIQLLFEVFIEYKAEREYFGVDWESVRNKYEQILEKHFQQYPTNWTDGFPNSENGDQTLTVKLYRWKT